ncbi:MAG: CDP-alcohol phosphatidyltransferase family protein, partial [Desulfobacterales bacterium]
MVKCLILAAGKGIRLSKGGDSKPLIPLLGLSLIERVILTAKDAGLTDFYVVTGYNGEKVRCFLDEFSRNKNVKITHIVNDEWEKGNGISVLKARRFFSEKFILLMTDHIFEEITLANLVREPITDGEVVLAADFNIKGNNLVDVNDVTKVSVEDCAISDIGKNLEEYNAYDTGMFLCSPAIFDAIEQSSGNGDTSLSGAVRILGKEGKAGVFDIGDHYWMDIDTPQDRKKAGNMLCSTLAKPHDGWVSRHINRKFSTRIFTPLILKLYDRITPNQVSVVSAVVGAMAGLSFFLHQAVLGGILIHLASILDGSDGEIARLKKMQTPFGNFFDAVLDRYSDCFILFGMFYYSLMSAETTQLFGGFADPFVLLISGLAISGNLMVSYTSSKSIADFNYQYQGKWIAAGRGRDIRLFVLFLGGVMAFLHPISVFVALFLVAAISNAIVLKRVFLSWKYSLRKDSLIKRKIKAVIFDFDGT